MKRIETLLYNLDLKKKKNPSGLGTEREKEKENCTTKAERRKKYTKQTKTDIKRIRNPTTNHKKGNSDETKARRQRKTILGKGTEGKSKGDMQKG